ncbi:MAG: F0F1 ATP synthase subunit epsilon [Gemmatimonadetes bacterium]|jgi:F-type H+-transporting ATPase subunit epsilon|nr:F0F1 ATP synthase subunit epsilon [Gemmatimonadota bacterium]MBT5059887.1 F0F1 ATP synthase subunit epsilon [Gemmatimonadota bacterium]MBT5144410.1 F0F1 ATP synthase subunit epsilon [Gemmatimonadota bacterium]MBT5587072.1 F0F1 ATP synthase subunit epsilon [Gemmatimonadota bacterium]MBT5960340.1 F0F1 ATP synthase subunit epsilon [Gemmatimonadota bacterium]
MAGSFSLRIVTPERTVFTGDTESLRAPGSEGSFGVLARHAPMVAALGVGSVEFQSGGDNRSMATSGGFVEVSSEGTTILAETAEFGDEINVERAQASRDRALERLQAAETDRARAQASLSRAINRLSVGAS